jgi:hypothetical protein
MKQTSPYKAPSGSSSGNGVYWAVPSSVHFRPCHSHHPYTSRNITVPPPTEAPTTMASLLPVSLGTGKGQAEVQRRLEIKYRECIASAAPTPQMLASCCIVALTLVVTSRTGRVTRIRTRGASRRRSLRPAGSRWPSTRRSASPPPSRRLARCDSLRGTHRPCWSR